MCGIVGLFIKNPKLESQLGALVAPMLSEMTERGPDSAGMAVYTNLWKNCNDSRFLEYSVSYSFKFL